MMRLTYGTLGILPSPLNKTKSVSPAVSQTRFGAFPLEEEIMREIGLGSHYSYYNGSGTSSYIRQQAALKLQDAIQRHVDAGKEIAPPNPGLITLLKNIAQDGEGSRYALTKTWQAASYIIAAHIQAFHQEEAKRFDFFKKWETYLQERYLPFEQKKRRSPLDFYF